MIRRIYTGRRIEAVNFMNLRKSSQHSHKIFLLPLGLLFVSMLSNVVYAQDRTLVSVTPLANILEHQTESAPAKIVDINHALLAAEISGRVIKIHVEKGDRVEKDQPLLAINCSDYTNQRKQAKASLKAAQAQYELSIKQYQRNQALSLKNTLSQNNVDISLAQKDQAFADVELKKSLISSSELAIDKCVINAPFQGQITERLSSMGDFLTPGKPVLRLLETQRFYIEARLTPSKSQSVKQANTIDFVAKNVRSPLKLDTLIKVIDSQTNTLTMRFSPMDAHTEPLIGLNGRIEWQSVEQYLPAKYLVKRKEQLGVMITEDKQTARFHPIQGAIEGQPTITALSGQTLLITQNYLTLRDADEISIE